MIINSANLRILTTGYRASFTTGLAAAPSEWRRIATEVPSATSEELYPWLQSMPGMREWIGDRQIKNVALNSYKIQNKKWEDTVAVKGDSIRDDQYGVYAPLMTMMGEAAGRQPDELVFGGLASGFTSNCFDGQFFFDTDHPVLDANGVETSVSNVQAGSGSPWYLLDTSRTMKPFIFQNRKAISFTNLDNPDDHNVFMKDEFLYGADSRNAFGFGFWQMAFASKAALTAANFAAAYDAMIRVRGDYGKRLTVRPNMLLVGPTNRAAAETIVRKQNLAGGESNLDYQRVELVVSPWLD